MCEVYLNKAIKKNINYMISTKLTQEVQGESQRKANNLQRGWYGCEPGDEPHRSRVMNRESHLDKTC